MKFTIQIGVFLYRYGGQHLRRLTAWYVGLVKSYSHL
jgi:hypothetical protein